MTLQNCVCSTSSMRQLSLFKHHTTFLKKAKLIMSSYAEVNKSCRVCNKMPLKEIFQCALGHLICKKCVDTVLKTEVTNCLSCCVAFDTNQFSRNVFAEAVIASTLVKCSCDLMVKVCELDTHKLKECPKLLCECKFSVIGCAKKIERGQLQSHEENCLFKVSQQLLPKLERTIKFRDFYYEALSAISKPGLRSESKE